MIVTDFCFNQGVNIHEVLSLHAQEDELFGLMKVYGFMDMSL